MLYLFGVLGVFLFTVPWTPFWDLGVAVVRPSWLGEAARSGWVRGLASGVGLLDLLIAGKEASVLRRLLRAIPGR
jgi:hypothetical protein